MVYTYQERKLGIVAHFDDFLRVGVKEGIGSFLRNPSGDDVKTVQYLNRILRLTVRDIENESGPKHCQSLGEPSFPRAAWPRTVPTPASTAGRRPKENEHPRDRYHDWHQACPTPF